MKGIREARTVKGMNQEQVAAKMRMSTTRYKRLEDNPGDMTVSQARHLAEVLGSSIDDLCFGEAEVCVTVEFCGLDPIRATVTAAELDKDFCTVTVLENQNARLNMERGTRVVVPRAIVGAAHGL